MSGDTSYSHHFPSFETLFVDENPDVINALAQSFGRRWADSVRFNVGNLFQAGQGVIVSPTNCVCDLSAGLDLQVQTMFPFLQDRLQRYISSQPSKRLPVGTTAWVETGDKAHPLIIFSPTFRTPMDLATSQNRIYRAVHAVFASVLGYNSARTSAPVRRILMPGFGTGLGDMETAAAANKISQAYSRASMLTVQELVFPPVIGS